MLFDVIKHVWASVSPDQEIEQTLMRSLGGQTRETGFDTAQRNVFLFSRLACAEISSAMTNFTGVKFVSSEQHKEASDSGIQETKISKLCVNFSIYRWTKPSK